jgi:hypothetical protein
MLAESGAETLAALLFEVPAFAAPDFFGLFGLGAVAGAPAGAKGAAPGRVSCADAPSAQRTKPQSKIETRQIIAKV